MDIPNDLKEALHQELESADEYIDDSWWDRGADAALSVVEEVLLDLKLIEDDDIHKILRRARQELY